jgi:hypothetical protein
MLRQMLSSVLAVFFVAASQSGSGHNQSKPNAQVTDARVHRSVSIEITVFSGQNALLVPYCSESEGSEFFCDLAIQIQIEGPNGWARIKPTYPNLVMGGIASDKWKSQLVPSGQSHVFNFWFSKDDFGVQRGQRLRVIVKTWPDEQSMRTQQPPIQLITAPFECP